jgi:hypothetical protein
MLLLGFLPGTAAARRTGLCCQPQNACLDGGFVDLDSVVAAADLPDGGALAAALHAGVEALRDTVAAFLLPSGADGLARHHVDRYVEDRLARALAQESEGGPPPDPRLLSPLRAAADFAGLLDRLVAGSALPDPRFVQSARDFAPLARRLLTPSPER